MKNFIGYYRKCDFVTMLGTILSFVGIIFCRSGFYICSVVFLGLSGICDALDGIVARKGKYSSEQGVYGVQLDSLSDCFCFGFFPSYITICISNSIVTYLICCFYLLCGIIRLAYFNMLDITKKARKGIYIGVPISAIAVVYPIIFIIFSFNYNILSILMPIILLVMGILYILRKDVPKIDYCKILNIK